MADLGFAGTDVESRVEEIYSRSFQRLARWRILSAISCVILFIVGASYLFVSKDSTTAFLNLRMNTTSALTSTSAGMNRRFLGTDRIQDTCTKSDISLFQGHSSPLPNGIPTYTVQIINLCVYGCPISNIHVACGWFASAKLVNPKAFRRTKFNDCLVNDGKPLKGGDSISFQYANSFQYPLRVESAQTCQ